MSAHGLVEADTMSHPWMPLVRRKAIGHPSKTSNGQWMETCTNQGTVVTIQLGRCSSGHLYPLGQGSHPWHRSYDLSQHSSLSCHRLLSLCSSLCLVVLELVGCHVHGLVLDHDAENDLGLAPPWPGHAPWLGQGWRRCLSLPPPAVGWLRHRGTPPPPM